MSSPDVRSVKWSPLRPDRASGLTNERLQTHHAAQFVSAMGISYLSPASDDSHTTLAWNTERAALQSHDVRGVTLSLRVSDLTLLLDDDRATPGEISLDGHTIESAAESVRRLLARSGLDAARYSLRRHFDLPHHAVTDGQPFSAANRDDLTELSRWFGNAAALLSGVAHRHSGSPVACWPHHFDIATLVTVAPGRSSGAGLSPGDGHYPEPYFYVNANPAPALSRLADHTLRGGGHWHTHEWIGAVLPGSALAGDASQQRQRVQLFLDSALDATRALLGG